MSTERSSITMSPGRLTPSARRDLLYGDRSTARLMCSPSSLPDWQFPGWGKHSVLTVDALSRRSIEASAKVDSHLLGQATATAICGNDITSSCLYTAGLTAAASGIMAPFALVLVSIMLYLFRAVYGEVGTALPMNGGAYNCLLNTTSKYTASMAAALTLLSYVATGTVSAIEAIHYLEKLVPVNLLWATQMLLIFFAIMTIIGITESGGVALVIFAIHICTMSTLLVTGLVHILLNGTGHFVDNFMVGSGSLSLLASSLLIGFSVASLGISGYETSANFIEEQGPGVFPKTLRNMWIASSFFNPMISFLSLFLVPLDDMETHKTTLLSEMGRISGSGFRLHYIVCLDAFLVLSGAVLTSYVGVTGLCKRMAYDRCLPNFLLKTNKLRGTNHLIILLFLLICSSMQWFMNGDVVVLSGVYSIAFLSVMGLFAFGDALLKFKRDALPRPIRAGWLRISAAIIMVSVSLVTTVLSDLKMFRFFLYYFLVTAAIISFMFFRLQLLKITIFFSQVILKSFPSLQNRCHLRLTKTLQTLNSQSVVFFAPSDHLALLNKAVLYIRKNELSGWIRIAHVTENGRMPSNFERNVRLLDSMFPKIRIDSVIVRGRLDANAVQTISEAYDIPENMMFICCPSSHDVQYYRERLGGVRIITRYIEPPQEVSPVRNIRPIPICIEGSPDDNVMSLLNSLDDTESKNGTDALAPENLENANTGSASIEDTNSLSVPLLK